MRISWGVSELWGVRKLPSPVDKAMAYTTACTTVQAMILGIHPIYKMRNISEHIETIFLKFSGFLDIDILARHAQNQSRLQMKIVSLGWEIKLF